MLATVDIEAIVSGVLAILAAIGAIERWWNARRQAQAARDARAQAVSAEARAAAEAAEKAAVTEQRNAIMDVLHEGGEATRAVRKLVQKKTSALGIESGLSEVVTQRYHPERVKEAIDAPPESPAPPPAA